MNLPIYKTFSDLKKERYSTWKPSNGAFREMENVWDARQPEIDKLQEQIETMNKKPCEYNSACEEGFQDKNYEELLKLREQIKKMKNCKNCKLRQHKECNIFLDWCDEMFVE